MALLAKKTNMPAQDEALPGRNTPLPLSGKHFVNGHRITPPFPAGMEKAIFGMGCFWGAERKFWQTPGVYSTAVVNTFEFCQNLRSAPQKQPRPNIACSRPAANGG